MRHKDQSTQLPQEEEHTSRPACTDGAARDQANATADAIMDHVAVEGAGGHRDTIPPSRQWMGLRTSAVRRTSVRSDPSVARLPAPRSTCHRSVEPLPLYSPGSSSRVPRPRAAPAPARALGTDQRWPCNQGGHADGQLDPQVTDLFRNCFRTHQLYAANAFTWLIDRRPVPADPDSAHFSACPWRPAQPPVWCRGCLHRWRLRTAVPLPASLACAARLVPQPGR
jgi:hypothetical protein